MAVAPDPKTFASWEEAFEYPIPAVRGMERQLRRDIDSNHERLRTLVGASYRDLLGTAESIISMDSQMHNVEAYIGEIGKRCNTRILEKKGSNLRTWSEAVEAPNSGRYAFASQIAVLRSCPDVISRLLKSGGSVLLAAKVLVISRLLHTKLSQHAHSPPYLETLRSKIGSLRRRLLGRIDRRFKSLDTARDLLVEAMCAFSLATSSSLKDVLRHFHYIRQEVMSEIMGEDKVGHENMLLALRLYVKTLKDTLALIPSHLSHALEKLKSISLFKSQDVYSLMELNLDVHERWIGDDIKTFTPYVRHDDLSKAEAERTLKQWAKQAFSSFLNDLLRRIQDVHEPFQLTDLRRQVFELWMSNHQHSMGIDSAETLDGLRDVFNLQATRIVQGRASRLKRVGSAVEETLRDWQPGRSYSAASLWDSSMTNMDMSNGGKAFRESLAVRYFGKNEPLTRVSHGYTAFLESIEAVEETITKLRETKWADDIDDVDDEDDLLDNKHVLLSVDDPGVLQEELNNALHEAYTDLQVGLGRIHPQEVDESRGQKSCFLIRIWRDLRQHLPQSYQNPRLGLSSIPELHSIVAEETLRTPLQRCSGRIKKATKAGTLPARPLWEGDPALPVLPSPWTYRFLLNLAVSMTACGSDIWSPQATDTLKRELISQMAPLIDASMHAEAKINGHTNAEAGEMTKENVGENEVEDNGEKKVEEDTGEKDEQEPSDTPGRQMNGSLSNGSSPPRPPTQSNDTKIQTLFDVSYLINATTIKDLAPSENQLISLQASITADIGLEARSVERIKKDAAEYWKRTSLLFGLLA